MYLLIDERLLGDEELLQVCQKAFDLEKLIFDGEAPAEWRTVKLHCDMAAVLAPETI